MIQPNLTRQIFSLQITPFHSKRTKQKAEHNNWSGHLFNILYIYERERRHWFQREDRGWGHQRDIQYHLVSHAIPGLVTLARCYQFACRTMNGIGCERNNARNSGKEAKDRVKKKKTNDIYIYIARGGTGYRFRDRKCKTYTNAERERRRGRKWSCARVRNNVTGCTQCGHGVESQRGDYSATRGVHTIPEGRAAPR